MEGWGIRSVQPVDDASHNVSPFAETLPLTPVLTLALIMASVLTLTCALTLSPAPARLGQSSTLTCRFDRPRAPDLGVEWSLRRPRQTLVAYSYNDGASQPQYQDARFMGRATLDETLLDLGDASLRLHNVTVQDEGRYRCIVHTRDWKTETDTEFNVTAPFSVPRVSCHAGPGPVVRLTCLATGGYPSSKLGWRWDNGSAYGPGASGTETRSATDGTFELRSSLDVAVSRAPALRCVLGRPGSNRSESSRATCPAGRSEGSVSMPGRCSNNDGSPAPCSPHRRIGVVLSAVLLLLLLVLLALLLCQERGSTT
ncbi:CD276 antigen-like [Amblyraja radiata]|uniref:CD276 antigen-like n=1 Tax=Amblyraja radiata TaxID=386614 RepID=UPI001402D88C|nr:CD276 antigen-like [Amblyraja radiata]